jgi:signal transduction histidine kinase/ActR/RegA family two-component response regulator
VRDSSGTIVGASKIARDISERKRAEAALLESRKLMAAEVGALATLNERSAQLWRSRTLEEGLEAILAAVIELLGAEKGNIQLLAPGREVLRIVAQRGFDPTFLDFFREVSSCDDSACGRALRHGTRTIIEDVELDGRYEPYRAVARAAGYRAVVSTPFVAADGTPLGIVSAHFRLIHRPSEPELQRVDLYLRQASDFIQRCRMEQTLREREEALREADRRKDEFLALLAHELRNPLAPIRYALAANLKPGRTLDQLQRGEEIIDRQIRHMSRLLDDLLDISRVTRGALELKRTTTELTSVVRSAIETTRPLMDAKNHTLTLDLPKHAVPLEADPVRLAQVFSNLLINAAKYTDAGGQIQLKAVQEKDRLIASIRDNGIGISADMMPRLFRMFSQAPTARGRSEGGLGVGLSLVRGLVALHGGTVEARSEGCGKGSEFIVRLPTGRRQEEDVEAETPEPRLANDGLRILVVDDNRDSADTCAALLELSGHHVHTAYTGARALELAQMSHPHVVLMDIGLPDVDGYQLAGRVRATPWGRHAVLIAVTGWGQENDRRRARSAGFDHHLTKPVSPEAVESLLRSLAPGLHADSP